MVGKPNQDSSKIRIGRYLLDQLHDANVVKLLGEELVEAGGLKVEKQVRKLLGELYRDMFSFSRGYFIPNDDYFGGREGFLKQLEVVVHALENPPSKEGWGKGSREGEPRTYRASFAKHRGRRL